MRILLLRAIRDGATLAVASSDITAVVLSRWPAFTGVLFVFSI